jgi:diguanylate cyclase (GGDEF)-like protein
MHVKQALTNIWDRPGRSEKLEFRIETEIGTRYVNGRITNMLNDFDVQGVAIYLSDVTARWTLDDLTRLHSRPWFVDRLDRTNSTHRETGARYAVLYIQLNRYQDVRRSLGAEIGDALLRATASRLRNRLRRADPIARLGDNTFGVIIENVNSSKDAEHFASNIEDAIDSPFFVCGQEIRTTVSVGIVTSQSVGGAAEDVLQAAASAVRATRPRARSYHTLYEEQVQVQAKERILLELDLRSALSRDQFHLVYQPIHDVQQRQLAGCEALIRWIHPDRGFISPAKFIPIAEETGLINEIGEWVLREACRQAQDWSQKGLQLPRIGINVSADQLNPGFLKVVDDVVHSTGIDTCRLKLEVTETSIIDSPDEATETLLALKQRGISLALDDFGTGFSSLSYLHRFPFDTIKIDRAFIKNLGTPDSDGKDEALVKTIVGLGQNLDMTTVAEGIETQDQLEMVTSWGCDYGQGYYLAKPMKADQLSTLLNHAKAG